MVKLKNTEHSSSPSSSPSSFSSESFSNQLKEAFEVEDLVRIANHLSTNFSQEELVIMVMEIHSQQVDIADILEEINELEEERADMSYTQCPECGFEGRNCICIQFADPGGNSALRAASEANPRNLPCPTCDRPNMLTPADVAEGYQCDFCADAAERGGP